MEKTNEQYFTYIVCARDASAITWLRLFTELKGM
jgi:hypothetical protein